MCKTTLKFRQIFRLAFGVLSLAAILSVLPFVFRAKAIVSPDGGGENQSGRVFGLENYDIRLDARADAQRRDFRERSGRSDWHRQTTREQMAAGENDLRRRVPTLKVEPSATLDAPEVIAPDARFGKAFLTGASDEPRAEILRGFARSNHELLGLSDEQIGELKIVAEYTNPDGVLSYAHLEQTMDGIPVFQAEIKAGFTKQGEMFRVINTLAPALEDQSLSNDFGHPQSAVQAAFKYVSRAMKSADTEFNQSASTDLKATFGAGDGATTAEKIYFPVEAGVARAAWRVLIWEESAAYYVVVDAETGALLWRKNLTAHQTQPVSYTVYANTTSMIRSLDSPAPLTPGPVDPNAGTQGALRSRTNFVTFIGNEAPHSFNNLGWIRDGNNTTDGNNVEAGLDRDGMDGVDAPVVGSGFRDFTFNYTPGHPAGGDDPLGAEYQKGAVTQLFYLTNRFHEELYKLGFTEAARNFQHDNFGRGGAGGDRIRAEAQDSSGTNNANFTTPADGERGRMQMYLWTAPNPDRDSGLDAEIVIHELTHGLSNRLIGNGFGLFRLMDVGMGEGWSDFYAHCLLSEPSDPVNGIYTVGGYSLQGLSGGANNNGNYYYGVRAFPKAVRALTGGPNNRPHNPLTFADIDSTQVNVSDGAYPTGLPGGRPFDPSVSVHNIGEVWSSALWEVRARFIQRLGHATGNLRALQYTTDGMKLTPNNPTFLQARDAIVQAATASGTIADLNDVWAGFAARGMGASASVASANPIRVTESFDVPAIVSNFNDSGGGSLRQAIADVGAGGIVLFHPLFFNSTPRVITLTSEIVINKNLTIAGTGVDKLTISGNNQTRVFNVSGNDVVVQNLTVANGRGNGFPQLRGGGIHNTGGLTIRHCHIRNNQPFSFGGEGGGIYSSGNLTIDSSTVSGNSAPSTGGGIQINGGTANIVNATVSGNSAGDPNQAGGGIRAAGAVVTITNSTVTNNNGGGAGGVLSASGSTTIRNSIIAGNSSDVGGGLGSPGNFTSQGYNLIGNRGATTTFNQTGDQTGTSANVLDAKLDVLGLYGGTTPVHRLRPDSPAIDRGKSFGARADGRGSFRPIDFITYPNATGGDGADIGAYEETVAAPVSLTVTSAGDTQVGAAGCADGCSLREAIAQIEPLSSGNVIRLNAFTGPQIITLTGGEILIDANVQIIGAGANLLTISGNNQSRIFQIAGNRTVHLSGMTIANGNMSDLSFAGGIYNRGTLTVADSQLINNRAGVAAAILSGGDLTITRSTIARNTATLLHDANSGGIANVGTLVVTNSTFSGNVAPDSGGSGGAIWTNDSTVQITNSTFTDNSAAGSGNASGIYVQGGAVTLRNTIIAANRNNQTVPDVRGAFTSEGYNLIGNVGAATGFNQPGDQTGTGAAPLNPMLNALALNGGTTPTHALRFNSPAIDTGKSFGLTSDGRGLTRPLDLAGYPNATGGDGADIGAFELQQGPPPCPTITLSPATLPNGTANTTYNQTMTASGGAAPYSFAVTSGSLPAGLSLNANGLLSGTPNTSGTFNFTVTATDANGCIGSRAYTVNISGNSGVNGLQYFALPAPVRLLDTRSGQPACDAPGAPLAAAGTRTQLARTACTGIPANALAIVGNATVVNTTAAAASGFITLSLSGTPRPTASNLNYVAGQIVPNAFTVGLSASGAFDIYAETGTHFIVDVTGYYAPPQTSGLYYHPLPTPVRLLDTRNGQPACDTPGAPLTGGVARTLIARTTCNGVMLPAEARAVVGNATVVNNTDAAAGFVTLYPSGAQRPIVSNLNYSTGQIVPNSFAVGLGSGDGAFQIYATTSINFVVDIAGYYSDRPTDSNGAGLLYYPLTSPVRLLDTRAGQSACDTPGAPLVGGAVYPQVAERTCGGVTIPASAQAVVGNATVVHNTGSGGGFVTLYPSDTGLPTISNLNYVPGQIVPNAFTVRLGADGTFNIYASTTTNFIVDVAGYLAP